MKAILKNIQYILDELQYVNVKYSLWKDDNLYEGYEAEYQQSTGNIASKTIVHLLGILQQEKAEEESRM